MPNIFRWPAERPLPEDFLADLKKAHDGVFVYPTNTLYGLGACIRSPKAIRLVFEIKARPKDFPLPVMANFGQIRDICEVTDISLPFLKHSDTRVTAVLPSGKSAPKEIVHRGTVAVRLPCSKLTESLVGSVGPITSTSANVHGQPTPAEIGPLVSEFGERISAYIDSGRLEGLPTTIIDFTGDRPKIIREGALSRDEMERTYER
ncbi:MAG: L-threonylcarbamoyladenylate synthase [Thermoplasmata archaeon]|nr:L-threonylcarbamoyladenylate synthase [Thermoplasmata archaeon]